MRAISLKALLSRQGLKATRQREKVSDIFLNAQGHKSLDQIYALVTDGDPKIGYTTVYRTMKLLTRLGLAAERKFADGETRYEPVFGGGHHDHFICLDCGRIIEFEDEALEALQNGIAERHRFEIDDHKLELYGRCADCSLKKRGRKKSR